MKAFANYHPAVLLLYFLSVLLVGMFVTNPVLQLTMLLGAVLFCLMLPHRSGGAGFYVPMFLLVAVTNPLFSHNGVTPLFYLNGNPVTLEAFVYGAAIAVMVVGVMLWCACYSAVMTSARRRSPLCRRTAPTSASRDIFPSFRGSGGSARWRRNTAPSSPCARRRTARRRNR